MQRRPWHSGFHGEYSYGGSNVISTSDLIQKDMRAPVMLWIRDRGKEHIYSLRDWRQYAEILVVDDVEQGLELLMHLPVDVLMFDLSVLRAVDPALVGEIHRCWPYLLCLVLSEDQKTDSVLQQDDGLTVLYLPEDIGALEQQLVGGFSPPERKARLH